MNTRASLANLTTTAVIAYALLTILTLFMRILTTSAALAAELGDRFAEAGDAARHAARASGTRQPRPGPTYYGTTTHAYNAASGGA
ncbi:hypothetical protein [Kutzneria buriramensis]|uniref:Uncharacterized protein n=1 Tax=Kutzneria buriramensis TaxID=1045776 RepID=A0A3E0I9N3_9PSEU|nr:hypothetical protein [Kutzneria buriramensis]REH55444.1 hypothetical protein BCF44_101465 [Kutzneria buriramensis]